MTINIIPQDIFQLIQTFLSNDDYHYFLNSSKRLFGELKRKTIFFKLNRERSIEYAMNKEFQDVLLSKVENGWNQIGIQCDDTFYDLSSRDIPIDLPICKVNGGINAKLPLHLWNNYKSIDCKFFPGGFSEIPPFPNVKDLHLRIYTSEGVETSIIDLQAFSHLSSLRINDLKVKDITPLKDIPHLYLSSCEDITDFAILSKQRELTLHQCPGLTDVSSFQSIRKLTISHCANVFDISALNGIYDLELFSCSNIKDISCLGNHHRLSLSGISSGFDSLLHIPHVNLMFCDIEDLNVLRFAKSVSLYRCEKVNSVSPLKNVKKVRIFTTGTSGFSELGEVSDLYLSLEGKFKCNDELIANLHNNRLALTMDYLVRCSINNLSRFSSSIKHLHITRSEIFAKLINNGQGVLLQHLHSLTLEFLPVVKLEGIGHIPTVRIVGCNKLKTVKGLGSNRYVELDNCYSLEDVSSLASVPIVTIRSCVRLTNTSFECLKNVPRLKIIVR